MKPPMLAYRYRNQDVSGWLMQEKMDGVRAIWTGAELLTRHGTLIDAPDWWIDRMPPDVELDGELWGGRGAYTKVLSAYRRHRPNDSEWRELRYTAFDLLGGMEAYPMRLKAVQMAYNDCVTATVCCGREHAVGMMTSIVGVGGEGVILRHPAAPYEHKRSVNLLKLKPREGADWNETTSRREATT